MNKGQASHQHLQTNRLLSLEMFPLQYNKSLAREITSFKAFVDARKSSRWTVTSDKLLEVLKMTDLITMIVDEAIEDAISDERVSIAKNALKEGATISFTKKITGLEESTIRRLQGELNI